MPIVGTEKHIYPSRRVVSTRRISPVFIRPSAPDNAFQACIDQFEIKDGNRLRNSGSAANDQ